jgi:hypothetical protein
MSDNHEDRRAAGRSWINFYGDYEPEYWSQRLGVSEERLRKIVETVVLGRQKDEGRRMNAEG